MSDLGKEICMKYMHAYLCTYSTYMMKYKEYGPYTERTSMPGLSTETKHQVLGTNHQKPCTASA